MRLGEPTLNRTKIKLQWVYKYSKPFIFNIFIIIFIGVTSSLTTIYKALVMKKLIDSAVSIQTRVMMNYLFLFGGIIAADLIFQAIISIISSRSYIKLYNNIQKNTYSHILNSRWAKIAKYHSGDISTRVSSDIDSVVNMIINIIPNIISLSVSLIGSFVVLIHFDFKLAITALLISPSIILISRFYTSKLKRLYTLVQQLESKYRSFLNESLQNIIIIKSFTLEKNNISKLTELQTNKLKLAVSQNNLNIINNTLFSLSSWITFFLVFAWSSFNLSKGTITYGTISAMLQLFSNIQHPFSGIASSVPKAIATAGSIERIMELEEFQLDLVGTSLVQNQKLGIELNNVSFTYNESSYILKGLSVHIKPCEIIAIIGPSGEGKTTIIRLLLSLIYPESGEIFILDNNKKLRIDASCRHLISYVPQGNTLFSGTIAENLRYGNKDATEEELVSAISSSYALDFIRGLDNGLDTLIGEHGLGLSEGQAQRIAIARALLKKSPILILDEATSALDMETELKVLKTVQNIQHKPTCIIITHRPSALSICDRVLRLKDGQLIEANRFYNEETAAGYCKN
jgi:ATP-binding cassette subfamily C protein